MISFYPGPSRIHDEIPKYVNDAAKLGIMSINHRSAEFVAMSQKTIALLKDKLDIPKNYTILYTTSATECWEIIAQSLIQEKSYHLYNGAFGQKWFEYTKRLRSGAETMPFHYEDKLIPKQLNFGKEGVICITQNETSNGTQVDNRTIKSIKKNNPNHLIAVDATSSMAGINLDFKSADIWFASVQKCFGLPAGLGIMICSPQAVKQARVINENNHYNSLSFMLDMIEKWQTPFTPNVLNIYLLMRVMEKAKHITEVEKLIRTRYERWENFFTPIKNINHLIHNSAVRSITVLPITAEESLINNIKSLAKRKGLLLGEGYGDLKKNTFRIANFPALKKKEIDILMKFLKTV
jgi:phosphoserine aminotransferase